jgi:hypothetical protein
VVLVFFLLKLLFLPIWLPVKIIGEPIGHSGRGHRHYSARQRRYGGGCLTVVLVVVLAVIGGIASACSGSNGSGSRPASSDSPTSAAELGVSPSAPHAHTGSSGNHTHRVRCRDAQPGTACRDERPAATGTSPGWLSSAQQ